MADGAEPAIRALKILVEQQAEEEGLWFRARYIEEAYLQQNLRALHAAAEAVLASSPRPQETK
jgi:hypothetical protein